MLPNRLMMTACRRVQQVRCGRVHRVQQCSRAELWQVHLVCRQGWGLGTAGVSVCLAAVDRDKTAPAGLFCACT